MSSVYKYNIQFKRIIWSTHLIGSRQLCRSICQPLLQKLQSVKIGNDVYSRYLSSDGKKGPASPDKPVKPEQPVSPVKAESSGQSEKAASPENSGKSGSPEKSKKPPKDGKATKPGPPKYEIHLMPPMYPRLSYDEINLMKGRHLSPHLSIYKPQITSVLSILLRISGIAMTVGVWIMGISALLCSKDINTLAQDIENCECAGAIFTALKFGIMVPFAYHLMVGARQILWNFNLFLTKPEIYATGYASVALTLVMAIAFAVINFDSKEESKDIEDTKKDKKKEKKPEKKAEKKPEQKPEQKPEKKTDK